MWKDSSSLVIVALYVDGFFVFFNHASQVDKLKSVLSSNFNIKDLGSVSECLGMKITRDESGSIKLDQKYYVQNSLRKFGMSDCVIVSV